MSKGLIANPPSFNAMQAKKNARSTKKASVSITPLVRSAMDAASNDNEKYQKLMSLYSGGEVTGSKTADVYEAAKLLVEWETQAKHTALSNMLENRAIRLVDIVKRIAPEMRRIGLDVRGSVILGLTHDTAE